MRPSHQFVAAGIGVMVALSQAAPGLTEVKPGATPASATAASLESGKLESEAVPPSSNVAAEADKPAVPAALNAQPAGSPERVTEPAPAIGATPDRPVPAAANPAPASTAVEKPQPQATPAQKPTAIAPSAKPVRPAPAGAAKPTKPRTATKPVAPKPAVKPLSPVKPLNLADFKALQDKPITQAPPVTPGGNMPPVMPPASTPVIRTPTPETGTFSQPIGPAKPGAAPEYLNPNPNPLAIPTRPEDVQLRGIQPITLQQALELAKRNNRELQVAILQLERSRAALREAQAALYPTIGTQAGLTQSQSAQGQLQEEAAQQAQQALPRSQRQIPNSDRATLALSGTVEVGYNIYTSGQRPARIRAAQQQVRFDQLAVEVAEQDLRFNVADAYYNLQEADEAVRIQESAVRNAEASLRDTQALERAGLGTRFDVLRAQVQLANARQDYTNALSNQRIRRRQLVQGLAAPVYVDLAAADPVAIAGSWPLTLPETVVLAVKNRAELEQQLAQRELAEQQRRLALGALGPAVNLRVQYEVLNNLRDTLGFGDGYSVTAGLSWNFFDGGAARARANQQEANKAIAEARFALARENIQLQVETAFSTLQSTFLNIGTNRQAVAQAGEALRLARLRFQAGVGTQTEVINAENDLTRAEGNLVTAIIGYNRALASLERSVTNLPIATGATTPSIPGPAPQLPPVNTF